jgi:hypothetical protein
MVARSLATDPQTTQAVPSPAIQPDPAPFDFDALLSTSLPPSIITSDRVSQTGLTVPSLWWLSEQLATMKDFGSKLLLYWLAYPHQESKRARVDLVVNRQLWSFLDYLQRYEFLHRFGTLAEGYGYNVRVFDDRSNFVGAYTCQIPTPKPSPFCVVTLDSSGKSSLRGGGALLDGEGASRGNGTAQP